MIRAVESTANPPDLSVQDTLKLLDETGVVLFRAVEMDLPEFEQYTQRFCSRFHHTAGRAKSRLAEGDSFSTWAPRKNISLFCHNEGGFRPFRSPDMGFFHCHQPNHLPGGETIIVDGEAFLGQLPDDLASRFSEQGIIFESHWMPRRWTVEFDIEDPSGMVDCENLLPGFEYRFEDNVMICRARRDAVQISRTGHRVFVNALLGHLRRITHPRHQDSRVLCNEKNGIFFGDGERISDELVNLMIDIQDELSLDYVWNHGDFLLLDNTRVMHGRRHILGDCERKVAVRFGHLKTPYRGAHP